MKDMGAFLYSHLVLKSTMLLSLKVSFPLSPFSLLAFLQ